MRVDTLGTVLIQQCNTLVPHVLQLVHLVSTVVPTVMQTVQQVLCMVTMLPLYAC